MSFPINLKVLEKLSLACDLLLYCQGGGGVRLRRENGKVETHPLLHDAFSIINILPSSKRSDFDVIKRILVGHISSKNKPFEFDNWCNPTFGLNC